RGGTSGSGALVDARRRVRTRVMLRRSLHVGNSRIRATMPTSRLSAAMEMREEEPLAPAQPGTRPCEAPRTGQEGRRASLDRQAKGRRPPPRNRSERRSTPAQAGLAEGPVLRAEGANGRAAPLSRT